MKQDIIDILTAIETLFFYRYLDASGPHFWGALFVFWSMVIAALLLLNAHR